VGGAANGVTTTLVTLNSAPSFATYIVTAGLTAGDVANYHCVSIVSQQGSSTKITSLVTASLATLSISGLAIRLTQNSGGTQTLSYVVTRIA